MVEAKRDHRGHKANIDFGLDIRSYPIIWIKPYINNARTHPRRQIDQIKAAIAAFGFTNPLLIDEAGNLIAGHGRLIAARELGFTSIPVITLSGLSPAQVKALRIADNKIASNSGWDASILRLELEEIVGNCDVAIELDAIGFTTGEVDVILNASGQENELAVPAVGTPRVRRGDIWALGAHRVGCGDARDCDFLSEVTMNAPIDCAFLDPPWNVKVRGHANVKSRHREFSMASGEMSDEQFADLLRDALDSGVKVSRQGAVHFICMDWRHYAALSEIAEGLYDEQLNLCIWNKDNAGMGSLYRSKHELVGVYRTAGGAHVNNVELGRHGRNRSNVWDFPSVNTFDKGRNADLAYHPTVKPVAMVADAIMDVTHRGDHVLDTFLGSGTTLLACERTGRLFRGLDIDPLYVDIAIDRWAEMTGDVPELLGRPTQ